MQIQETQINCRKKQEQKDFCFYDFKTRIKSMFMTVVPSMKLFKNSAEKLAWHKGYNL